MADHRADPVLRLAYHRIDGELLGRLYLVQEGREPPLFVGLIRVPQAHATDFLHAAAARHFVELSSEGEVTWPNLRTAP